MFSFFKEVIIISSKTASPLFFCWYNKVLQMLWFKTKTILFNLMVWWVPNRAGLGWVILLSTQPQ